MPFKSLTGIKFFKIRFKIIQKRTLFKFVDFTQVPRSHELRGVPWHGNILANQWQLPEASCNLDLTKELEDLDFYLNLEMNQTFVKVDHFSDGTFIVTYFTYIVFPETRIRYMKIPQETLLFVIFLIQLAGENKDIS